MAITARLSQARQQDLRPGWSGTDTIETACSCEYQFSEAGTENLSLLRCKKCQIDRVYENYSVPEGDCMAFLLLHRLGMPLRVEVALVTEWYPASARSLQRVNRPSAHDCPTETTGWIYFGVCVLSRDRCPYHTHMFPYCFIHLELGITHALNAEGNDIGKPALQIRDQVTFVPEERLGSHGVHNI